MTVIASARTRALSIISIMVIAVLLSLSSAVQATGEVGETIEYRVQPGDTLWEIARESGPKDGDPRRMVAVIQKLNSLDSGLIQSGQVIEIPVGSS